MPRGGATAYGSLFVCPIRIVRNFSTEVKFTVLLQSIAGPLKNAYCVRKSSTITFLCNHAICNVRSFSTEVKFTVMVEDFRTQYAVFNGSEIYCMPRAELLRHTVVVLSVSHSVRYACPVAYLRVGLVGPRPHQVRRCPTICGHILGHYTVNHQVPCHIIDNRQPSSGYSKSFFACTLIFHSLADRQRD